MRHPWQSRSIIDKIGRIDEGLPPGDPAKELIQQFELAPEQKAMLEQMVVWSRRRQAPEHKAHRPTKLPREKCDFLVHFSSPVPGREPMFWREGPTPDAVVELWPTAGEEPFEQRGPVRLYGLGPVLKDVIYRKSEPNVRWIINLAASPAEDEAKLKLKITSRRLECPGALSKDQIRQAVDLLDNFVKLETRGRPRGSGHPLRKPYERLDLDEQVYLQFQRAGLSEREIQIFSRWSANIPQTAIAQELRVSPSAIYQRLSRIEKKMQKINPRFSLRGYHQTPEHLDSGQRRNSRKQELDITGRSYIRDVYQELERQRTDDEG